MTITKQTVAEQIATYLHHDLTLGHLVDWSKRDAETIAHVMARLGVADVRAFGLAWEDCEYLLGNLVLLLAWKLWLLNGRP
jgi:TRAP-type C4-dicarboxylate transport system permease large subunit